ncbi:MAG: hypothetical protein E7545_05835 [Ruminococcaceae bacterium]|nr:hypothetical protein [Oscillospiraceae bacterium]
MYNEEFLKLLNVKNQNRVPHDGEIEICLCSRCASTFYSMPDHGIDRVYKYQFFLEPCIICKERCGYDFYVWQLQNIRNEKNRTFEEMNEDE